MSVFRRALWCAVGALVVVPSVAMAQPFWQGTQAFLYTASGVAQPIQQFYPGGGADVDPLDDWTITLANDTERVVIVPGILNAGNSTFAIDTSNTVSIPRITFTLSSVYAGNRTVRVAVAGNYIASGEDSSGVRWGKFWGGMQTPLVSGADDSRVNIRLYACVGNTIKDSVNVEELVRLETGTEIAHPVNVGTAFDGITRIQAGRIYPDGDITIGSGNVVSIVAFGLSSPSTTPAIDADINILGGNLGLLQSGTSGSTSINGNFEGKLNVPDGAINEFVVYNGDIIGPAATPPSTPVNRIIAKNGIGSITADAIDCDIITNYTNPMTTGTTTGYLETLITNSGNLKGQLTTRGIGIPGSSATFGVSIAGNVDGTIDVAESVLAPTGVPGITIGNNLAAGSLIRVRNSLQGTTANGGIKIEGEKGLKGQVIINGNLNSSQWQSDVDVQGTSAVVELRPDGFGAAGYTTPSADVGKGAVGTVPYRLYKSDCAVPGRTDGVPADGSVFYVVPSQMASGIDLRFYGPVKAKVTGVAPLRVFKPFSGTNGEAYVADLTCFTEQVIRPTDVDASMRDRTVRIKTAPGVSTFPIGYYKITSLDPTDPSVQYRCDMDPNTPDPLRTTLVCDLATNSSGVAPGVSYFDVYFVVVEDCNTNGVADSGEYYGCGGACPADLDDGSGTCTPDAGVDINDLLMFLVAFEAGTSCADLTDGLGGNNPDGGVDINDLLYFLAHFEMGC